jgi:hypothetical protein
MTKDYIGEHFCGAKRDCLPCALRLQCLRTPETTTVRNVAFLRERLQRTGEPCESHKTRMKVRIDSAVGREQYGRRFDLVEPLLANLRHNKRLDRFTLRGRRKVDAQWKPYCLVHTIDKLANAGYAA